MYVPAIQGVIDRRILVNYRIRPEAAAKLLPDPFRPQLVGGWAIGGICLIRLKEIRPRLWPRRLGIRSENAAYRFAVEWQQEGQTHTGVYIPRRETSSRLNAWAGGRLFPGVHHLADFEVSETNDRFDVELTSRDGEQQFHVVAERSVGLPKTSVFTSVQTMSEFFAEGSYGYSPRSDKPGGCVCCDGLELRCATWSVQPLAVAHLESSFFGDTDLFGPGDAEFDCALLMQGIPHSWHTLPPIPIDDSQATSKKLSIS